MDAITRSFDSRAGFRAAVLAAFRDACEASARRIVAVDLDFADWPLDERELLDTLTRWLRLPQRQLVLLAAGYEGMARAHPRFTEWRPAWTHGLATLCAPEDQVASLPCLLVSDKAPLLRVVDRLEWRGRTTTDAQAARSTLEQLDAVLQRSPPGFPVLVLGL